ncbi:MAG: acetyltransferase [Herbinix sp.]|jgi:ribosomal protein S18 acetylase RimI-like enzyme|nr:acetyltransferase [Herbinix sp.]
MIEYRYTKDFDERQIEELFKSVSWFSGNFPKKLKQALHNSSSVISAWDGKKLIGLIRGLDDGIWQATIDCLLVNPQYQGIGVASSLLKRLLAGYKEFLYVDVVPDEKKNVEFYLKHGFELMLEGTPLQIKGTSWE